MFAANQRRAKQPLLDTSLSRWREDAESERFAQQLAFEWGRVVQQIDGGIAQPVHGGIRKTIGERKCLHRPHHQFGAQAPAPRESLPQFRVAERCWRHTTGDAHHFADVFEARFTPWPASGCSTRAASPTSNTRGAG